MIATELEFAEVAVGPTAAVQISSQCAPDSASIGNAIGKAFQTLGEVVCRHGLAVTAAPRVIYKAQGPEGLSFDAVMPVAAPAAPLDNPAVSVVKLDAARAYRFTHHGSYQNLKDSYARITEFMTATGRMKTPADWARYMPMWEEYVTDPAKTAESELVTHIFLPVR